MSELEDVEVPDLNEMATLLLIQSMRNYDVMMHLLKHFDEETAIELSKLHESHQLWGPLPYVQIDK